MAQHLQTAERRKIQKLYLSGARPTEIARKMALKPASVRQHLYREGLTKRRDEIAAAKQHTALEVLESVRRNSVADFAGVLGLLGEGLKIDARKLRDGWGLVEDAAGASSLMRAKKLHLDRTCQFFGVDKPNNAPPPGGPSLSLFFLAGCDPAQAAEPKPVKAVTDVETTSDINPLTDSAGKQSPEATN